MFQGRRRVQQPAAPHGSRGSGGRGAPPLRGRPAEPVASYLDVVDSWHVYDNAGLTGPRLIASRAAGWPAVIAEPNAWEHLKEQHR